jgi:ADP-ribosyl-[dinitrogen reductase] hydrolase
MILEGAIGDTYGAGFEFADIELIRLKNNIAQYEVHPLFSSIYKKYTDDTQMTLGIAELLIENSEWTKQSIANKFVTVFKRDPREGYAKRFYSLLNEINSGQELLDKIIPDSERNGSVMRVYPIGILKSENEILEKAKLQSQITHNTENAIVSAQAVALTTHFFLYEKGLKSQLLDYLHDIQKIKWTADWSGEVSVNAIQTVRALFTILIKENSLKDMLKKSIDFGGDVDTVASLALAIGCLDKNVENNLPNWLFDEIENGKYGKDYIKTIDNELYKLIDK